jgi:hypothetical protein
MEPRDNDPERSGIEHSSRTLFLVILAIIVALILAFLIFRPNPGGRSTQHSAATASHQKSAPPTWTKAEHKRKAAGS